MTYRIIFAACLSAFLLTTAGNTVMAQMNNRPFSFNTPGGGPGISMGGRQAILNNELFGATPDNLVRGDNGILLEVTKIDGNSAIVRFEGGSTIPSFRGTSFRGDNDSWTAGSFNAFFEPRGNNSFVRSYAAMPTGSVISTWTGRVASNMPVSFSPSSPVDLWTGMVMQLPY